LIKLEIRSHNTIMYVANLINSSYSDYRDFFLFFFFGCNTSL